MFRKGLGDDGPQLDEFPFILGDKMLTQPACGIYADITAEYLALDQVTSWYLCWKLSEARALTVCVCVRRGPRMILAFWGFLLLLCSAIRCRHVLCTPGIPGSHQDGEARVHCGALHSVCARD